MDGDRVPRIGEVVHFVLSRGNNAGSHRPAIVVGVRNAYTVDLQVFSNGTKGSLPQGDGTPNVFWNPGCVQDEQGHTCGTWHFPEPEFAENSNGRRQSYEQIRNEPAHA